MEGERCRHSDLTLGYLRCKELTHINTQLTRLRRVISIPSARVGARSYIRLLLGARIGGSIIGSRKQIENIVQLAVKSEVKPWVQARPMRKANQAVVDLEKRNARYRYVLTN